MLGTQFLSLITTIQNHPCAHLMTSPPPSYLKNKILLSTLFKFLTPSPLPPKTHVKPDLHLRLTPNSVLGFLHSTYTILRRSSAGH